MRNAWIKPLTAAWLSAVLFAAGCGDANRASDDQSHPYKGSPDLGAPIVLIGANAETRGHLLHRIRGLFRMPDGRIVVGNNGSSQIRVFDPSGSLVAELGGPGAGPEEFQSLQAVFPFKRDSIAAWDPVTLRVSVWSPEGTLGRTVRFDFGFPPQLEGIIGDSLLVWSIERFRRPPIRRAWSTWVDSLEVSVSHLDMEAERTIVGLFANAERVVAEAPSGDLIGSPAPLSHGSMVTVGGGTIYVAMPEANRIQGVNPRGSVELNVIPRVAPRPRSAEDGQQWVESLLMDKDVPRNQRGAIRQYYAKFPQPERYPTFDQLLLDSEDAVWLRRYVAPDDTASMLIQLSQEGEVRRRIDFPPEFQPTQIGPDWILGTLRGENDVEMVALFPLTPE